MTTTGSGMRATSAGGIAGSVFAVPFAFLADAHLKVYRLTASTDASSAGVLLVLGTDYTISGDRRAGTASVTVIASTVGLFVRRERVTARAQGTDLIAGQPPSAAALEDALDREAMAGEERDDVLTRAVAVPFGEAGVILPALTPRKGLFLRFNLTTGLPEAADPLTAGVVPVVAYTINTLAAGASATFGSAGAWPNLTWTFGLPRGATGASGALSDGTFGDIVVSAGGTVLTVGAGAVTLAKMANFAAYSIMGNNTASGAISIALSIAQTKTLLSLDQVNNTSDANKPIKKEIEIACSDETTGLSAGVAKVTFRMTRAMTLTDVRASLTTAQAANGAGGIFTVDVNESGVSILSTKLTIDNTEKTSTTAVTPRVISDTALADDAEITIDIDVIGDGSAKGLKVYLIGTV